MNIFIRLLLGVVLLAAGTLGLPGRSTAEVMYMTNSRDADGHLIWTQPAYAPASVIGLNLTVPDPNHPGQTIPSPLQNPHDVFIDRHDNLFVVDTGNNRIVEFDPNGGFMRFVTVPSSQLNAPQGLFVTDNGDMYIADTGNKRIVHLDSNGNWIRDFKRPQSPFIPDAYKFDPARLVVDKRGFLYIATLGGYLGLMQLDPQGNFQSFYGANKTVFSALDTFKRAVFPKKNV